MKTTKEDVIKSEVWETGWLREFMELKLARAYPTATWKLSKELGERKFGLWELNFLDRVGILHGTF